MGEMARYILYAFLNQDLMPVSASVYREIGDQLTEDGYGREQYSVWQRYTTAMQAWTNMLDLRQIRPRGVLATVVRRLEMFHVPEPQLLIVTDDVRLGGIFSPIIVGPTPAGLSQGIGGAPPALWPNGPGDELPSGVRDIDGSWDPNNWRL
jgi:hypothetical protein